MHVILTPPQLRVRARSFPVPSGRTATGGGGAISSESMTERSQPAVPSPPHASTRRLGTLRKSSSLEKRESVTNNHQLSDGALNTHARLGPSSLRSNTWRGLSNQWNLCSSFRPWLPPLFGLMKTTSGLACADGIGLMTNGLLAPPSTLRRRFTDAFFFL